MYWYRLCTESCQIVYYFRMFITLTEFRNMSEVCCLVGSIHSSQRPWKNQHIYGINRHFLYTKTC